MMIRLKKHMMGKITGSIKDKRIGIIRERYREKDQRSTEGIGNCARHCHK